MSPKEVTALKDAIRAMHGCESLHVKSVSVKEVFEGQTAWEGTVEVFELVGHSEANQVYAWTHRDGDQNNTVVVLKKCRLWIHHRAPSKRRLPRLDQNKAIDRNRLHPPR
jgi:hypothetical protein